MNFLDFEKPIAELEAKIEELRHLSNSDEINIAEEINRLQIKVDRLLKTTYAKLTPLAEDPGGAPSRPAAFQGLRRRACSPSSRRWPATAPSPTIRRSKAGWRGFAAAR